MVNTGLQELPAQRAGAEKNSSSCCYCNVSLEDIFEDRSEGVLRVASSLSSTGGSACGDSPASAASPVGGEAQFLPSSNQRRTKIVCTLGPSTWDTETLVELLDAGVDIFRFNFSHGDHPGHQKILGNVRAACAQRPGRRVALMLDTKGPEIRITSVSSHGMGVDAVALKEGDLIHLTYEGWGDSAGARGAAAAAVAPPPPAAAVISCSYPSLLKSVHRASLVLLSGGAVRAEVVSVLTEYAVARVLGVGTVRKNKSLNLPGVRIELPCCGEKEVDDLVKFCVPNRMEYVAASFVQCGEDVRAIRRTLRSVPGGEAVKIIAKIENQEALLNFDQILAETDAVMIARGDLGQEIPLQKVFLAQKYLIKKCNLAGKPVIVATELLQSMASKPSPSRAEISDIANAVLDGADCLMLSHESANGAFPVKAVQFLSMTCMEAEAVVDYPRTYHSIHKASHPPATAAAQPPLAATTSTSAGTGEEPVGSPRDLPSLRSRAQICGAGCSAAVEAAEDLMARAIIVLTPPESAFETLRLVAKYKPRQPILAAVVCGGNDDETANPAAVNQLCLLRGVIPLLVRTGPDPAVAAKLSGDSTSAAASSGTATPSATLLSKAVAAAKAFSLVSRNDVVVVIDGLNISVPDMSQTGKKKHNFTHVRRRLPMEILAVI